MYDCNDSFAVSFILFEPINYYNKEHIYNTIRKILYNEKIRTTHT